MKVVENTANFTSKVSKKSENQVPTKERFAYALSDFGCNTVFQIVGTYFLIFATNTLGIAVAATTGLFALSAIIDSFDGLIWGQFIDRTNTRWGKSRPYWLWFSIPFAIFCVMSFSAPGFIMGSEVAKIVWIYIAYIGAKVLYSAINIPVTSILPTLTSNPQERVTLSTIRQFFGNMGSAIFLPLTLPAVAFIGKMFGDSRSGTNSSIGWTLWATILGTITVVAMMIAFKGTKERVVTRDSKRSVPMRESIKAVNKNYPWMIIIFINFVFWGAFAIRSSALPYYFKYNLGQESLGSMTLLATVLQLATTVLIPFLAKRIGKRNTMMIGMLGTIISQIVMYLSEQMGSNVTLIISATCIFYLSQGLIGGLIAVMLADAVDYGEWKNGIRAEGFVTSFSSFSAKLGMGLGSMILSAVLAAGSYVATTSNVAQSSSALQAISLGFIWIPLGGYILSAIALAFNNVDKIQDQMTTELEAKHARELI